MSYVLKELDISSIDRIEDFYVDIFSNPPWNDDWSDEKQLHTYITELIGNSNSLTLGYFWNAKLVGLCMGHIRHWFTGKEYYIDEFCVCRDTQGMGIGTKFLKDVEKYIIDKGIIQMFLLTEREVPAYQFYQKNGFVELSSQVSFVKRLKDINNRNL